MPPSRSPIQQIVGATILLIVAAVLFFPAYLLWNASIQRSVAPLRWYGQAPAFQLKDQLSRMVGNAELRGRVWVVDFVKIGDQEEGELLTSRFAELDQNFRRSDSSALISFSRGAATATQLQDYAARYEASPHWHFLAGEDITSPFAEWSTATSGQRGTLPLENAFILVDQKGEIRGVYDATAPEVVQKIFVDVGNLLRAEQSATAP
jgi:protein SCO1/2